MLTKPHLFKELCYKLFYIFLHQVSLDVELVDDSVMDRFKTNSLNASMGSLNIRRTASDLHSLASSGLHKSSSFFCKNMSLTDLGSHFPRVLSFATLCHIHVIYGLYHFRVTEIVN